MRLRVQCHNTPSSQTPLTAHACRAKYAQRPLRGQPSLELPYRCTYVTILKPPVRGGSRGGCARICFGARPGTCSSRQAGPVRGGRRYRRPLAKGGRMYFLTKCILAFTTLLDHLVHMFNNCQIPFQDALRSSNSRLSSPLPGTAPNFTNAEDRGAVLTIVNGFLLVVMAIFMVIRAYTKPVIIRKLSWDDLTVSISAIGAFALYGFLVWGELAPFYLAY